jgi:hypothetical protein
MNSDELLSLPAMASPMWDLPRPRKAHGQTRHLPRIIPVLSHFKTMGRRPIFVHSSELPLTGNGYATAAATVLADQPPPSSFLL